MKQFSTITSPKALVGLLVLGAVFYGLAGPCSESSSGKSQQLSSTEQVPEGLQKSDWSSIRAAHTAWQHSFQPVKDGWQARNPGQQWTTIFDGRGFLASPREGAWTWGLELKSYGLGASQRQVGNKAIKVKAEEQRLSYQWDNELQEWWLNDARGLEHGYTLYKRPIGESSAKLELTMITRGTLKPVVSDDQMAVQFQDESGATVLNYSGLKVWDADGRTMASHFESEGDRALRLVVEEGAARYPLTIDPIAQQAYVKISAESAGTANDGDMFGWSVAVSGDTVVVGAPNESSSTTGIDSTPNDLASYSGAAYVFVRSGNTWLQQAYLKCNQVTAGDRFGTAIDVNGDTVVVGADREDGNTTGVNGEPNESASNSGAAYVFVRNGSTWSQQAYLKASQVTKDDYFGASVAINGNTLVVGATGEDSGSTGVNSTPNELASSAGAAYVFVRSGSAWSQQAYLKASSVSAYDGFSSVDVSGDTVVVGAYGEDSSTNGVNGTPNESAENAGAVYVFVRNGSTWSQQAYLKASEVTAYDSFGSSVAADADTVVVGASGESSSTTGINGTTDENAWGAGAAYVFVRSGSVWSQQAFLKASQVTEGDQFGGAVSVSGNTLVVGAYGEDNSTNGVNSTPNESATNAGAAYVFVRNGSAWSQQAYLKASQVTAQDGFGRSVAVSGDTVVVGAYQEDSETTGINSIPNDLASDTGAASVFVRSGSAWEQHAYMKISTESAGTIKAGDNLGCSVAVSGNTVVVGARYEDSSTVGINSTPDELASDSGAAYVFVRNGSTWSQQAYLKASQVTADDNFGTCVAVSGDTVVVGAPKEDGSMSGINNTPNELMSGSGAAYVFVRNGSTWSQQAYLKASNADYYDTFGGSVAISEDTAVVGAVFEDSNTAGVNSTPNNSASDAGASYVFVRNGNTWSQEAYLKANQVSSGDQFGNSVALSGDTLVIGASYEDSSTSGINATPNKAASSAGSAYVFVRNGSTWSQQAYLKASQVTSGDLFGTSVAVSGDTVVVGARDEDSSTTGVNSTPDELASGSGAAYVFVRSGNTWIQQAYLKAHEVSQYDSFGQSVAVSGDTVVIGADGEGSNTTGINGAPNELASNSGAAYVFLRKGSTWSQQAFLKASQVTANDRFGISVAASGGILVIGASLEDSSIAGINNATNETALDAGAAFIFSTVVEPSVSSPTITGISAANATLGGSVDNDGGLPVIERGVVYAATAHNPEPQINGEGVVKVSTAGDASVFTIPVNGLIPATAYSFRAYATNNIGTSYSSVAEFTTLLGTQEIIFGTIPNKWITDSLLLTATGGGSGHPVTFAVTSGPGVITDGVLTFTSAGSVTITASQAGNANYLAAEDVSRTFTVTKAPASIQFADLLQIDNGLPRWVSSMMEPGRLPFDLRYAGSETAPSLPGVYAVTATLDDPIYVGSGSATLTILGLSGRGQRITSGSSPILQANGTDFGRVVLGRVATQTFTITNPGSEPVALTGEPLVEILGEQAGDFQISVPPAAEIPAGGRVSFEVRLAPTQPGDRRAVVQLACDALANGPITFAVGGLGALPTLLAQTITFNLPSTLYLSQSPVSLIATASSGLPVTLTVLEGPATLTDGELQVTEPGKIRIEARQAGGGNFAAAKPVVRTLTVKADPTGLTLADLTQTYNGAPRPITVLGTEEEATVTYLINKEPSDEPPTNAGSYPVTVTVGPVTKTGTLIIARAPLLVQVTDQRKLVGEANPSFTAELSGFIGEDTENTVLFRPISITTKAKVDSPPGLYPITSSGGAAANYTLIHRPGTLVVEGHVGTFEALLRDPDTGLPAGLLKLTVPSTGQSLTANLALAGEAKPIPLAGPLELDPETRVASAQVSRVINKTDTYQLDLTLSLFGELVVQVRKNEELIAQVDDGTRLRDPVKGEAVPQAGAYTAVLEREAAEAAPSAPGWATAKLDAAGVMALAGRLADGTVFTASLPNDVSGGYRLFVQPYKRAGAHLAGAWALTEHPEVEGAWQARGVDLTWVKSPNEKDLGYRAGFGPLTVALEMDAWQPASKTVTLAQLLGTEELEVSYDPTGSPSEGLLPSLVALDRSNSLLVLAPVTNPVNLRKWKAKVNGATGAYSGSFELLDLSQKRTVNFTGVLRQAADAEDDGLQGRGLFILPPLKGAVTTETTTGRMEFRRVE